MDREALTYKGTVSVISSEPPCKDDTERFTTVPLMILFIYTVYFHFCFVFQQKWVAHFLLIRKTEKITE